MDSIVIVGAGNIGSRHLQGLSDLGAPAHIHLIDPDPESRSLAEERWNAVDCNTHSLSYHESIAEIDGTNVGVAILATPSSVRRDVFETLIQHCDVESVIFEKVLFQTEQDYETVARLLRQNDTDAWVNCPRRYFEIYKTIEETIATGPIEMSVSGTQWGLGCNAIHYVDLFGWLTGSQELEWDNRFLEKQLLEAKRNGFVEFAGTLSASDTAGNLLTLTSFEGSESYATVTISTPTQQWIVQSFAEEAVHITNEGDEWVSSRTPLDIPYVSELTGDIVNEILETKTSDLPTYTESKAYHLPLLQTLRQHVETVRGEEMDACPIT